MSRVPAIAIVAIVLWGSTILAQVGHAQDKDIRDSGIALTDATLKTTLQGLGYEPTKLTNGYLIALKKEEWTYNVQFLLSADQSKIGLNANLGLVDNPTSVLASQWMALLSANADVDPSSFYFDKTQKKLFLHRALDNRAITPAYIRQQTDNFISNIKSTSELWKFTK